MFEVIYELVRDLPGEIWGDIGVGIVVGTLLVFGLFYFQIWRLSRAWRRRQSTEAAHPFPARAKPIGGRRV